MEKINVGSLVKFWTEASRKDIHTAQDIFDKTKNYVTVLFYLHLSLEKILKAVYVKRRQEHGPFSHNLIFLSREANLDVSEKDLKLLSEINEFNIESRYPDEKFLIYKKATKAFTEKYLKETRRIYEWISETLKTG